MPNLRSKSAANRTWCFLVFLQFKSQTGSQQSHFLLIQSLDKTPQYFFTCFAFCLIAAHITTLELAKLESVMFFVAYFNLLQLRCYCINSITEKPQLIFIMKANNVDEITKNNFFIIASFICWFYKKLIVYNTI